jgi:hypothetical protein
MRRKWILILTRISAIAAFSAALCSTSLAQESQSAPIIERSATVQTGKVVRIGVLLNVHKDCSSGPLPMVNLLKGPRHGNVQVRRAKATVTNVANCLATRVPAYVVFYKSYPEFTGREELELEVRNVENGAVRVEKITVTVTGAGLQL